MSPRHVRCYISQTLAATRWVSLALGPSLLSRDRDVTNYADRRDVDSAGPDDRDAGAVPTPLGEGVPLVDTAASGLTWDVFGSVGARYWFVVSEAELERMNTRQGNSSPELYWPGASDATFADHLVVTTPGRDAHSADFGKVEVRLLGQTTGNPWTLRTLPNLRVDADEFMNGKRIGGEEHLRFNTAVAGNIFREKLTLELYRELDYPAPRTSYVWVSSSVWGPDVAVPYILVEPYKRQFCERREIPLGGGCVNMWELVGDYGGWDLSLPENCQFGSCDAERALALDQQVQQTPLGAGYKAALADWIDWEAYHRFQCLSWILETGDDAAHGNNNVVLAERADGKFQYLPYSVDVSLGQWGYEEVPLPGASVLATGCQSDPECWAATIAACEGLVAGFAMADPIGMLNGIHAELEAEGMLRDGDETRYQTLVRYLEGRLIELPIELELNRAAPYFGCDAPLVRCGEVCGGVVCHEPE